MYKGLIVVESPSKAKTIAKILKNKYKVLSSVGHIKDLPKSRLGIKFEGNHILPEYIKIRGKAKVINEIKKNAKKYKHVYIATDPDREGEAIAGHIAEEVKSFSDSIIRLSFLEITPIGIDEAFKQKGNIDRNLIEAHKARRVLDRLVGYKVSPILWKTVAKGLSAGRVQTVVLRFIIEREREIEDFTPEKYYTLEAYLEAKEKTFKATYIKKNKDRLNSKDKDSILKELKVFKTATVSMFKKILKKQSPYPPFITATMQQEASSKLKFSSRKTMRIAQMLYEGISIGKITKGLITYMRTDSQRISPSFQKETENFIRKIYGEEFVYKKSRIYKDKKGVQGGHEAIRPTDLSLTPEKIKGVLNKDQYNLYKLIYNRYLASQMNDATFEETTVNLKIGKHVFKSRRLREVFKGYEIIYPRIHDFGEDLPDLDKGDSVNLLNIKAIEHITQPPARFSEAQIIKLSREKGIGRPSTYASMISTLYDRNYVTKEQGKLRPTELGIIVHDILIPRFSEIFEVGFTGRMEDKLDLVASGKEKWEEVVFEFYRPFVKRLESVQKTLLNIKKDLTEEIKENCPLCGRPLIIKWGRHGKFIACSGFPECSYTRSLKEDNKSVKLGKCPECGADLILKRGRYGEFIACSKYPSCKYTAPLTLPYKCPLCGSSVAKRKSKKGYYYSCTNKECKFYSRFPLVEKKCPKCNVHFVKERKNYVCKKCGYKEPV